MSRPAKEDSVYRVSIHRNAGYNYAATHPYVLTEEGKRKYSLVHWGTVTDDLQFVPGKHWYEVSEEERARLIFPQDWDLRHIRPQEKEEQQDTPEIAVPRGRRRIQSPSMLKASVAIIMVSIALGAILFALHPAKESVQIQETEFFPYRYANTGTAVETLVLGDHTKVFLKPGSEIQYNVSGMPDRRVVNIEGEAFFDVARDTLRPFTVKTRNISINVLGTAFSVCSSASHPNTEVLLERGSVRLESPEGAGLLTLSPDQRAVYSSDSGCLSVESVKAVAYVAEHYSLITLEDATLYEIIASLRATFGSDFKVSGAGDPVSSYHFNYLKSDSLSNIVASLEFLSGAKISY